VSVQLAVLLAVCAPAVHPTTAHALVQHESRGHPWAVGMNGARLSHQPATQQHALGLANTLIALGYTVDIGYAQINSLTLRRLGLTIEQGFEPCTNLRAMQTVLVSRYQTAAARFGDGQVALRAALSAYNTGNMRSGLTNGYVAAVYRRVGRGAGS
jgi:type IV secretion system protein VirB1